LPPRVAQASRYRHAAGVRPPSLSDPVDDIPVDAARWP
jgi:hypothetical protein